MITNLYPLKLFFTRRPVAIAGSLSLLINLVAWLWLYFGATPRGEDAVLHYSILFQVNKIGAFSDLYFVPGVGLCILILNTLIAWTYYNYNAFLAQTIMVATVFLELGILAAVRVLVFLNG